MRFRCAPHLLPPCILECQLHVIPLWPGRGADRRGAESLCELVEQASVGSRLLCKRGWFQTGPFVVLQHTEPPLVKRRPGKELRSRGKGIHLSQRRTLQHNNHALFYHAVKQNGYHLISIYLDGLKNRWELLLNWRSRLWYR